jgi:glycosyltransferase involved in cell wall biosynthesis
MKRKTVEDKILFLSTHFYPDLRFGGVVESGSKLLKSMRDCSNFGITSICVSESVKGVHYSPDRQDIIIQSSLAHSWGLSFYFPFVLYRQLKNVDKVFINGIVTFPTTIGMLFCILLNKKFVVSIRGGLEPWRVEHKKYKKRFYFKFLVYPLVRKASFVHVTSSEEKNTLVNLGYKNVKIISNGINLSEFALEDSGIVEKPESLDVFKFLFLSRTDKEKGIDLLISAYNRFCRIYDRSKHKLIIVGPDNQHYLSKQKLDFKSLNVEYSTGIYGLDKVKLMKSVDVFVLPSFSENFGNVIAESLVCGTPVITTSGTPWKEIEKVGCGLYIEPNVDALLSAMEIMFNKEKDEMQKMGLNGYEYIKRDYLWENKAQEMINLLNDI